MSYYYDWGWPIGTGGPRGKIFTGVGTSGYLETLKYNVYKFNDKITYFFPMAGVKKSNIKILFNDGILFVTAKLDEPIFSQTPLESNKISKTYSYEVKIESIYNVNKLLAIYEDGLLKIQIPRLVKEMTSKEFKVQ